MSGGNHDMNAFEWLAGGLFFANSNAPQTSSSSHRHKRELQAIEHSKDVKQLWTGVQDNFVQLEQQQQLLQEQERQQQETTPDAVPPDTSTDSLSTVTDFLAARVTRLRYLLFEERKLTSSSNFRLSSTPSVALATVQFFVRPYQQQQEPAQLWPQWICPQIFQHVPFETRKTLVHLFCYLLVSGLDGPDAALYRDNVMSVFVQQVVLSQFPAIITQVLAGYASKFSPDIALHCGSLYRTLLRHGSLYQQLVGTTESVTLFVFPFLDTLVHTPNFDVASDAMECLRLVLAPSSSQASPGASQSQPQQAPPQQQQEESLLSQQRNEWAAEFMTRDYEALWDDRFVPHLLFANEHPNNYMTKRGALQILASVLLTRTNYTVMVRFVASARNLKVILLLLRHTSPHITLDAFHVFKVFVANPHKPPEVIKILKDNQVKLCAYLKTLHADKAQSDAQFRDEKALIIATIEAL